LPRPAGKKLSGAFGMAAKSGKYVLCLMKPVYGIGIVNVPMRIMTVCMDKRVI